MLTIRLSRIGKKNKPLYRLIISEKSRDPWGRALEILGSYNPHAKNLQARTDRIKYWLSKGAKMSPTVNNLLVDKKIIESKKVKASKAGTKTESRETETA
ncbi:30S ribosomal protein S16 [Candidatus Falkowbacteria bacterium]|nr:30S ribosomal protein S16 [Candidatus Falkowbacteria bacterium]